MIGWMFLGIFLLILFPNMIYAFILKRCEYGHRKLFFWNMLLKLCNIPIYVLVFAVGVLAGWNTMSTVNFEDLEQKGNLT